MDPDQPAPRGRMTDRYTVWAGSISRAGSDSAVGTPAANVADAPAESIPSGQGTPPGSASSGTGEDAVDRPPIASSERVMSRTAGSDLAMSRLQTATGGSASAAQAHKTASDAAARDAAGIGAAEAALDEAVDRFLVSAQVVDASLGGTNLSDDTGAGVTSETDVTSDVAGSVRNSSAGLAGLMDDLSGHAMTGPDQATQANDKRQDQISNRSAAAAEQSEAISQGARERTTEAAERVETAEDKAGIEPRDAGSDKARAIREGDESPRDEIGGGGVDNPEEARPAGPDAADMVDDGPDRAGERLEHTVDHVEVTAKAAAGETSGAIAGAASELRHHLTSPAQDLLSIGRDSSRDTGPVAGESTDDLRLPVSERAGIVADISPAHAGAVADDVGQTSRSVTGAASEASAGTAGSVRDGSGGGLQPSIPLRPRPYSRLIVSAVALGTVSGLNRWVVRRLTGADVTLLGPATVHPAILGTGLATLIASLYLVDDQSSLANQAESTIRSGR